MPQDNAAKEIDLFFEDWRSCLEAHFRHVIVEKDINNEKTLLTVLHDTGFTDAQIDEMRARIKAEMGEVEPEIVESVAVPTEELITVEAAPAAPASVMTSNSAQEVAQPERVPSEMPQITVETVLAVADNPPVENVDNLSAEQSINTAPPTPDQVRPEPAKKSKKPPTQMSFF